MEKIYNEESHLTVSEKKYYVKDQDSWEVIGQLPTSIKDVYSYTSCNSGCILIELIQIHPYNIL